MCITLQAYYARDALAKNLYSRLFSWLVTRINESIQVSNVPGLFNLVDLINYSAYKLVAWHWNGDFLLLTILSPCRHKLKRATRSWVCSTSMGLRYSR